MPPLMANPNPSPGFVTRVSSYEEREADHITAGLVLRGMHWVVVITRNWK